MTHCSLRQAVAFVCATMVMVPAVACSPTTTPTCVVTASATEITATFPIVTPPFIWRWRRAETPDHALEYRWEAAFGSCSSSGQFEVGEYSFGVQLFKFPGARARSGQLDALLKEAQHTFVQREATPSGNTFRMDPGANVSSTSGPASLRISVRGGANVAQLLTKRPRYALLTVNVPEPGQSYTCHAEVEYR